MDNQDNKSFIFDPSKIQSLPTLPTEFKWPEETLVATHQEELDAPLIDLKAFGTGDEKVVGLVRDACTKFGFFKVINHGVDLNLIDLARKEIENVFNLPVEKKQSLYSLEPSAILGYSGGHAHRYSSMLVWKETFSSRYAFGNESRTEVLDYFKSILGDDYASTGVAYQKYCEEMESLAGDIFELLAVSMGLEDRFHLKKYFEDANSIIRSLYSPPCDRSEMVFGSAPHTDYNALTILHQDQVGGLEVFYKEKWQRVRPQQNAFVVNIGDILMALSNGYFKSSIHRAIAHREKPRLSLVFFVFPNDKKVVEPLEELVSREGSKKYPNFTWPELFEYVEKHRRAIDAYTLSNFANWVSSKQSLTA